MGVGCNGGHVTVTDMDSIEVRKIRNKNRFDSIACMCKVYDKIPGIELDPAIPLPREAHQYAEIGSGGAGNACTMYVRQVEYFRWSDKLFDYRLLAISIDSFQ